MLVLSSRGLLVFVRDFGDEFNKQVSQVEVLEKRIVELENIIKTFNQVE